MERREGTVAYLGPDGSYSMLAARQLCPQAQGLPCKSFFEAVQALREGRADSAVLPVENTLQGAVTQNLDLLYANDALYAVREFLLPIEHRLIAREGTALSEIRRIFSHQQAILQCGKFLSQNLPHAQLIYTDSTMDSLRHIERAGDAGIVGSHVRRKDLLSSAPTSPMKRRTSPIFSSCARGASISPRTANTSASRRPARTSRARC